MLSCLLFLSWLSCCQHIDQIMSSHGKQIMQAVTLILEAEHNIEVKEQVSSPSVSGLQMVFVQLHKKPALQTGFNTAHKIVHWCLFYLLFLDFFF